jgi:hypothetical protein
MNQTRFYNNNDIKNDLERIDNDIYIFNQLKNNYQDWLNNLNMRFESEIKNYKNHYKYQDIRKQLKIISLSLSSQFDYFYYQINQMGDNNRFFIKDYNNIIERIKKLDDDIYNYMDNDSSDENLLDNLIIDIDNLLSDISNLLFNLYEDNKFQLKNWINDLVNIIE